MTDIELTDNRHPHISTGYEPSLRREVETEIRYFDALSHLTSFEERFPAELSLFRLTGIHPECGNNTLNPYTREISRENYTNIGEHSLSVGYCASRIADALCNAAVINSKLRDRIISRALIHDITKPYEIMRREAFGKLGTDAVFGPKAYEKLREFCMDSGLSPEISDYLVNAGSETGHLSLKDLIVCGPHGLERLVEGKLAEKIVHLADDMTFTNKPKEGQRPITLFLTCWERMLASQFPEKYPFLWNEGLGVTTEGTIKDIKDIGNIEEGISLIGNYAKIQVAVANATAREIQLLVAPSSKERPEVFVKNLVNMHI